MECNKQNETLEIRKQLSDHFNTNFSIKNSNEQFHKVYARTILF